MEDTNPAVYFVVASAVSAILLFLALVLVLMSWCRPKRWVVATEDGTYTRKFREYGAAAEHMGQLVAQRPYGGSDIILFDTEGKITPKKAR